MFRICFLCQKEIPIAEFKEHEANCTNDRRDIYDGIDDDPVDFNYE